MTRKHKLFSTSMSKKYSSNYCRYVTLWESLLDNHIFKKESLFRNRIGKDKNKDAFYIRRNLHKGRTEGKEKEEEAKKRKGKGREEDTSGSNLYILQRDTTVICIMLSHVIYHSWQIWINKFVMKDNGLFLSNAFSL